ADREREDALDALQRWGQRLRALEIAADDLDSQVETRAVGMSGERANRLAGREQLAHHLAADGARGSGHEDHRAAWAPMGRAAAPAARRTCSSEMMCRLVQTGTPKVGIRLSGRCSITSGLPGPRSRPSGDSPLSTPPPMAPTKSITPRMFRRATCRTHTGARRAH